MSQVIVVDYNPDWPIQFDALRFSLLRTLRDLALRVEHVGSTSVPGLSAKPELAIDVVVSTENETISIEDLEANGYIHLGDLGIPDREAAESTNDSVPHNLYLYPTHSQALANHLAVREYLRCNPVAARAYAELKQRLASEYLYDIAGHVEAKSGFLLEVLRNAGFDRAALLRLRR